MIDQKIPPHPDNFCGGKYQDWLEVMLLPECNGRCEWCIEKTGWHPKEKVHWKIIADEAINTGRKNIILLGGEPTLYKNLGTIIDYLHTAGLKVYITTNGSRLNREYIQNELRFLSGINISIHSYNLDDNESITGVKLTDDVLKEATYFLKSIGVNIRFNCNLIKDHIYDEEEILSYIRFAQILGADSVRFAELRNDQDNFIDLYKIFGDKYGLNDDPYLKGCNKNVEINGMHINFRQMCGLQTSLRPQHPDFKKYPKQVLYYDGKVYDGWQIMKGHKEKYMNYTELIKVLESFKQGWYDINQTIDKIKECVGDTDTQMTTNEKELSRAGGDPHESGGGCVY
ncbi:MAG: radical SAM protein [Promethearchaeota archaeon]|jgi:organic radical activating enzyme